MPLGAARLNFLAKSITVAAEAEVIRKKVGITALADAQVDTAQSKFGGASAYFDGTGDLLQASTDASLTIPADEDFTIEGWIRPGSVSGTPGLLTDRASSTSLAGVNWDISIYNGSYLTTRTATLLFETGSGAGSIIIISNNNVFSINTWYHFAVVRSSNVISLYVDGVDVTNNRAGTQSSGIGAGNLTIGGFPNGALMYSGHQDEIRWSNTARYTAGFTPSTTPFVNDDNTLLLMHMDGTDGSTYFDDDNGVDRAALGVSALGNAQVDTAESQFGGASLLLDGAGDSLKCTNITLGSGDWTMEGWINRDDTTDHLILSNGHPDSDGGLVYASGTNLIYYQNGSARITGGSVTANTWHHVAAVKNSGTTTLYLNGTSVGTWSDSVTYGTKTFGIGNNTSNPGSSDFDGHIDEVRVSDTARYTSGFTPSTTPFVNDANTLLLLHMDGTDASTLFLDDNGVSRSRVGFKANASAQITTSESKFGGASLDVAAGDWIQTATEFDFNQDFTIEGWFYFDTTASYRVFLDTRPASTQGFYVTMYAVAGDLRFVINATEVISHNTNIATGGWHHIALTRSTNDFKMWYDGSQVGSTYTSAVTFVDNRFILGADGFQESATNSFDGKIDEFRISNTVRYTASFTPDTAPFQNDANTLLLLHLDGTNGGTDFVDDNGKQST